jgi:flagellar hook assembly protein FlgD
LTEPALYLQNYPNPFRSETSISFSLPEDGFVNISVFDIHGKVVRDLAGSFYQTGTSAVTWNGNDNQGRPVKPGIYVCRINAGDHSKSIRMVVR